MALYDFVNSVLDKQDGEDRLREKFGEVLSDLETGKTVYGSVNQDLAMSLEVAETLAGTIATIRRYLSPEKEGVFTTVVDDWLQQNAERITAVRERKGKLRTTSVPHSLPKPRAATPDGNHEKLANALEGSLYEPANLQKVREQFAGKRVVVIDLDGVIRGYRDSEIVSDQALAAIDLLLAEGCALVLWTTGKIDANFMRRHNLAGRFSLIIGGGNFDRRFGNEDLFKSALLNTPWLSAEEKSLLQDEYLRYDGVKPIPMAFAGCSIIEDSTTILPEYFRKVSSEYNFIYTPTFNGNGKEDYDSSKWFGTQHLNSILSGPVNNLERLPVSAN